MTADEPGHDQAVATVRTLLTGLMRMAEQLPEGLDSRVEFGICDRENIQLMSDVDVDVYTEVTAATGEASAGPFIILRAHHHPGEVPGKLLRAVASDADTELRKLTGEEAG